MATPAARKRRRENPVEGVSCTCSKCCADSCSACHHNYVKPVSNCMGAIRTMMTPSNNRVQIVPIVTEQSNGVQSILMTRKGGRTRRRKRRRRRKSTKKKRRRRRKRTKKKRRRKRTKKKRRRRRKKTRRRK